jgi:hypothetical protein
MPSITGEMTTMEFIQDMLDKAAAAESNYAPVETPTPQPTEKAPLETVELHPEEVKLIDLMRSKGASPVKTPAGKTAPTGSAGRANQEPIESLVKALETTATSNSPKSYEELIASSRPAPMPDPLAKEPGLETSAPELILAGIPGLMRALLSKAVGTGIIPAAGRSAAQFNPSIEGQFLGRELLGGPQAGGLATQTPVTVSPVFRALTQPQASPNLMNFGELLRQTAPTVYRKAGGVSAPIEGEVVRPALSAPQALLQLLQGKLK